MKKINLGFVLLLMSCGNFAQGQTPELNESETNWVPSGRIDSYATTTGWAGYLGAGAGYTGHNKNPEVEGFTNSLKILGSFITKNSKSVFDFAYGIQSQKFSETANLKSGVSTGVAELAARFQFKSRWQLGVVFNQFFTRGESVGANQADAQFAGPQLLREFGLGNFYQARAGGRVMTSVNAQNEAVNIALLEFQLGWGGEPRSSADDWAQ